MNILIASGIYPPESGGPATYSSEAAQALRARGHTVTVVSYGESEQKKQTASKEENDVTFVSRSGGPLVRYLRYTLAVYRAARQADILFVQGAVSEGVPSALVARFLQKPLILRVPGDYAWEMGRQYAPKDTEPSLDRFLTHAHRGKIGVYERLERWTAHQATRIIVPSAYLRSVVERWRIPTERIDVIKNAVQPLPKTAGRSILRKQWKLENHVICLTAVRAVPWKGVAELLEWWHRVPASHILVVAGDGPELEAWKKLSIKEGLGERVRFLGRVSRQGLAEWYDVADTFILHTGYEGYPHTVPEAVSRGLPCLVSDQGGNPETQEEFGAYIAVLPYQDRDAWIAALCAVPVRTSTASPVVAWTHKKMIDQVEERLKEGQKPGLTTPARIIMVGYERELLKTESSTFARVASLATPTLSISALVVARLPDDVATERDGLRVQAFGGGACRRVWQAIRMGIQEAKRLPTRTLVTGQDPFAAGLIAYAISRWTNQPLELQEHGDFWSGAWQKEHWTHRVWAIIGIQLLKRAERIRVVSERVKGHLVAKGIQANKVAIIPVAQELEELLTKPLPLRDGPEWVIRVPCRFVQQKGLNIVLDAFAKVHEQYLNARLEFVGAGPLESWVLSRVQTLGLSLVVTLRPWMEATELWDGADMFVMSSRYEGYGRTVVEAMAAGVPVVATDVGCVGSILRHEQEGLVVPVEDASALSRAMMRIIEDEPLRTRLQLAARERIQSLPTTSDLQMIQRTHWLQALNAPPSQEGGARFEVWVMVFVIFAIAIRFLSVILFHDQLLSREWGFFTLVQHWLQGYGYSFASELGCGSAYRSPGYLFFLTALYRIFGSQNTWAQAIVQNIVVVGALWLTYIVGKRLVGRRAALVGGFFMACYPYTFYHYTQFYHTFLQSFLLLLVVWFVLRVGEVKRLRYAIGAGLAIGALAYVQGTILPVTPFIALWVAWQLWPDWKRALISVALMGICAAGLIAPWTYRNWTIFHEFVPLTTDLGHALFKANNENIYEITQRGYPQEIIEDIPSSTNRFYKQYRLPGYLETDLKAAGVFRESVLWTEWHPREPNGDVKMCAELGMLNEYTFNQYWMAKTQKQWHDRWGWDVWRLPLQKIKTFWSPGLFPFIKTGAPWSFAGSAWKEWGARTSVLVSTGTIIILGLLGWCILLAKRQRAAWLVGSFFLVFTLLHALVAGYTKYRIPLDHLLAPYAAYIMLRVIKWMQQEKTV